MNYRSAILAALVSCLATQAPAQTRAPIVSVSEAPRDCSLTIGFGSYAMGIDGRAFERVSALLMRDRGLKRVEQYRWGREGEVTLCARTRAPSDARRLFSRVRAMLPAKPRGPVTVTAGRLSFQAPRSR